MQRFDLKLSDGRTVSWTGETGEDAARRYVDAHREPCDCDANDGRCMMGGPSVVAWREPRAQLRVGF